MHHLGGLFITDLKWNGALLPYPFHWLAGAHQSTVLMGPTFRCPVIAVGSGSTRLFYSPIPETRDNQWTQFTYLECKLSAICTGTKWSQDGRPWREFWTSVSVLFAVLYVSSSPLRDFNLQFLFGSTSKTFTIMEKVHRRIITGPILHIRVFKRIHYCRVA